MKKYFALITLTILMLGCSDGIEDRPRTVAAEFAISATEENYDELALLVDLNIIKTLKLKYYKALNIAKNINRDRATVHILFGDHVEVDDVLSLTDSEFLNLIINREFEIHDLDKIELVGGVCESKAKCYEVLKFSRKGINADRTLPYVMTLNSYDEGDTWHIDPDFFMTTRLIHSFASKAE